MNICGRARPAAVAGIRKGKGTLAPFTFLTGLPEMQTSLSNACHAGYAKISRKNLCRRHLTTGFVIVFPAKALGRHRVRINKYKQIEEPTQLKEKKYFLCMTFTICDLHVLMRIHAWNRAKLTREIQNFGGKQSVQMASAKKAGKLLFITGSGLYLFKRALHLRGSDIVRRHARPAARLARRLEGEDLFAG